jgi:two-component system, chemotaxis family, CheB/CheR fusion protein
VKIYATDVDEHALGQARAASYSEKSVASLAPPLLEKYFLHEGDHYIFDKEPDPSSSAGTISSSTLRFRASA